MLAVSMACKGPMIAFFFMLVLAAGRCQAVAAENVIQKIDFNQGLCIM
jgi:hypothetical protein